MLILSREVGQSITIGKDICITIVGNKQGQVRLGIQAPKEIKVLREELEPYPNRPKMSKNMP